MTRIAIVGASGYAGGELARLVTAHPAMELGVLTASRNEGRLVRHVHPHLRTLGQARFSGIDLDQLGTHDVIVLALPHRHSGELGEQLAERFPHRLLVDLGADRRLRDRAAWDVYYGGHYHPAWTYGMPELVDASGQKQRQVLRGASRIVAPGCNATAVTLSVAPLVAAGLIDPAQLVATLAVAPSGAGRTLREDLLASERLSSATAYALGGSHRHIPEIVQNLEAAGARAVRLSLAPMLVPMSRGILSITTTDVAHSPSEETLWAALNEVYHNEAFVDLLSPGEIPTTGSVLGSNTAAIGVALDETSQRAVVACAIDNLYKGTAGAAIQSLNIALGFEETSGLEMNGVSP